MVVFVVKNLTLGSLFDGIGGWQIAAVRAGIKPAWSSEIAPFPVAVTAKHFPETLQMGDITKLDGTTLPPVDIICAGSPCQGLSLAGKRRGLQDERSGLFIKSVEIFRQMRVASDGEYPRFFVWENVLGAFSSNRGEDFQAVLTEIGQTDVPMPRSVSRDTAESITSRKEVAAVAGDGAQASSWCIAGNVINRKDKNGGHHLGVDENVSFTLNTIDRHAVFAEGDAYCLQGSMIGRKEKNGPQGSGVNKNVSFTLNTIDRHAVCIPDEKTYSVQAIGHIVESEKSSTLAARDYKSPRNFVEYQKEVPHEADRQETDDKMTVRRLTVTECERLQGFPDGYTDVPLNGKPASESERLKAIGNGMAQPCADFVLRQLAIYSGKEEV